MNYRFYTSSEKAWEAMFEAITSAQHSIYLEMYIFQYDMEKFNFFEALKAKAVQGVRVKIILDSFGSMSLNNVEIAELQQA